MPRFLKTAILTPFYRLERRASEALLQSKASKLEDAFELGADQERMEQFSHHPEGDEPSTHGGVGANHFADIPRAFERKAHMSAFCSMVLFNAVPAPCPALVSIRIRTGGPSFAWQA